MFQLVDLQIGTQIFTSMNFLEYLNVKFPYYPLVLGRLAGTYLNLVETRLSIFGKLKENSQYKQGPQFQNLLQIIPL